MIKLNLGCGNKLYPKSEGWINVDIVTPKVTPEGIDFVQGELKSLPFEDNSVDEAHAYHVIEHFYRVEVPVVLKEWLRVLKPGGKLILEQPDILKCAANIFAGMTRGNDFYVNKMGILGFFGDGTPDEPYMSHKWGWYPESLGRELHKVGFVGISSEDAQTHMKTERDFRIVGTKS